jgi:hypothetical protein
MVPQIDPRVYNQGLEPENSGLQIGKKRDSFDFD